VIIGETARRGFAAGPLIVLGHVILEIALIIALVGGLSAALTAAGVSRAIALLGGGFLLYMGYAMARDALTGRVTLSLGEKAAGQSEPGTGAGKRAQEAGPVSALAGGASLHPVLAGILISLSNPYWSLWWITIGLGYITLSLKSGTPGLLSFFTGHILADLVWYSLVAAAVAGGRRFMSDRVYRGLLVACGVFLVGLGGYFLYSGFFLLLT
jgi:threonine/homoserine/homoserine lactone efflux protein